MLPIHLSIIESYYTQYAKQIARYIRLISFYNAIFILISSWSPILQSLIKLDSKISQSLMPEYWKETIDHIFQLYRDRRSKKECQGTSSSKSDGDIFQTSLLIINPKINPFKTVKILTIRNELNRKSYAWTS